MKNMGDIVYYSVIALIVGYFIYLKSKESRNVDKWFRKYLVSIYNMVNKEKMLEDKGGIEKGIVKQWFRKCLVSMYNMVNKEKPLEDEEGVENILELEDDALKHIGLSDKEYFDWSKLSDVERRDISLRLQMMEQEFNIQFDNYIISAILPIFSLYRELLPSNFTTGASIFLISISLISLYAGISLNSKIYKRRMFAIYLKKRLERYEMLNMNREAVLE